MTHIQNINTSACWCNEVLPEHTFYFKGVEEALANNIYGDREICSACRDEIIKTMRSNKNETNEPA